MHQAVQVENRPSIDVSAINSLKSFNSDSISLEDQDTYNSDYHDPLTKSDDSFYEIGICGYRQPLFEYNNDGNRSDKTSCQDQKETAKRDYRAWIGARRLHLA